MDDEDTLPQPAPLRWHRGAFFLAGASFALAVATFFLARSAAYAEPVFGDALRTALAFGVWAWLSLVFLVLGIYLDWRQTRSQSAAAKTPADPARSET